MMWIVLLVLVGLLAVAVWWGNRHAKDVQSELNAEGIKSVGMFSRFQSNVQRRERRFSGSGPDRTGEPGRQSD